MLELLDGHAFRNAINAHLAGDEEPAFTVAILKPDAPGTTLRLGEVVRRALGAGTDHLVGHLDGAVAVYLHGAPRPDVAPVIERFREEWRRSSSGELAVEIASHPAEEHRVIDLLSADWGGVEGSPLVPNESGSVLVAQTRAAHQPLDRAIEQERQEQPARRVQ